MTQNRVEVFSRRNRVYWSGVNVILSRKWIFLIILFALLIFIPVCSVWWTLRQKQLNQNLIAAIVRNDARSVTGLLEQGADPNTLDAPPNNASIWQQLWDRWKGRKVHDIDHPTALLVALLPRPDPKGMLQNRPENVPLVKSLLDHGADVNCQGAYGYDGSSEGTESPLCAAIQDKKTATYHLLLRYGAKIRNRQDHSPLCATMFSDSADSAAVVKDLINLGADVDQPQSKDDPGTALWKAAQLGDLDVVRVLLAHHANVTLRDDNGLTPLQEAENKEAENEEPDVVNVLGGPTVDVTEKISTEKITRGRRQIIRLLRAAGAKQ